MATEQNTQTGKIGVTTENIFPVIKKFLYSDHEIFLRELVANAVDATQKMKALAASGEFKGELGELKVSIVLDEAAKTLKIIDEGIGMTAEEVDKYINQIAFSSAGEFLEKYKDQISSIIGHFGLGFYSAFMVADKVTIETLSWKDGAKAVKWTCDGSPEYSMEECTKSSRGTEITLYLSEDSSEFASKGRIQSLLEKYCKFMPVPVVFGKEQEWKDGKYVDTDKDNVINNIEPLWTKKPSELKDEDYNKFYSALYPMAEEPLFHIHLNVDYPFTLTGILYFPKIKDQMEISRNKIQLFCNQMFVTDSVEAIVPDYLTLLHGVIDSPDIPLNVSRSYLQADSNVKMISGYITKKVADRLEEIFKKDRQAFEEKWDNVKLFIGDVVGDQPGIQQALAHKAERSFIIGGIAADIQLFFQLKQNIEQPGAVVLQQFLFHHEHIEVMAVRFGHVGVIRRQILRAFALDDGAGHPQVLFMVGVDILGIIGFNKIVALFRQHNIGGGQNSVEFLVADDPTLFALKTVQAAGKVTAVMHDADIIGIQVFGRPVQARQLAEIAVAL